LWGLSPSRASDEDFARAFEHGRSLLLEDAAALALA
jgi:hypothetical protein